MKYFTTLFCTLLAAQALAQVGINNPSPEQALDVGGKIKLADDASVPTAGTIRYNSTDAAFEGYDGNTWTGFASSSTPYVGARPIAGSRTRLQSGSTSTLQFRLMENDSDIGTTPPLGKLFVITYIGVEMDEFELNSIYSVTIQRARLSSTFNIFDINCRTGDCPPLKSEAAPLLIL